MTPTLTSADPAGWYLATDKMKFPDCYWWTGTALLAHPYSLGGSLELDQFTNFRPLIEAPDWPRLRAWAADPNRKPPALAFSAGVERDVADTYSLLVQGMMQESAKFIENATKGGK